MEKRGSITGRLVLPLVEQYRALPTLASQNFGISHTGHATKVAMHMKDGLGFLQAERLASAELGFRYRPMVTMLGGGAELFSRIFRSENRTRFTNFLAPAAVAIAGCVVCFAGEETTTTITPHEGGGYTSETTGPIHIGSGKKK